MFGIQSQIVRSYKEAESIVNIEEKNQSIETREKIYINAVLWSYSHFEVSIRSKHTAESLAREIEVKLEGNTKVNENKMK